MDTYSDIFHNNVLASILIGVLQVDLDGIVVYANRSVLNLLGINKESDLLDTHSSFNITPFGESGLCLEEDEHALYAVLDYEKVITSSLQEISINGEKRWLSVNSAPIYDEENKLVGGICNLTDITEKVVHDQKQPQEEGRYKILIENINAVVWETKIGTQTFSCISPKASDLPEFPKKDWLKEGFWQSRIYEADRERVISYERHKAPDGDSYQLEYRLRHADGDIKWVQNIVEVVKVNGKPELPGGLMLDITDQKASHLKLRE